MPRQYQEDVAKLVPPQYREAWKHPFERPALESESVCMVDGPALYPIVVRLHTAFLLQLLPE